MVVYFCYKRVIGRVQLSFNTNRLVCAWLASVLLLVNVAQIVKFDALAQTTDSWRFIANNAYHLCV